MVPKKIESPWAASVLETYDRAILAIDDRDRVLYANNAARALLEDLGHGGALAPAPEELARLAAEVRETRAPRRNVAARAAQDAEWRGHAWLVDTNVVALALGRSAARASRVEQLCAALSLKPTEAKLALAAADGHSNRDIAADNALPVGTVATRMWRLYRKLGIRNRAELATLVASVTSN